MTLVLVEGPSYEFVLLADSHHEAIRLLAKGWRKHLKQCGIADGERIEDACTVNFIDNVKLGTLYRDYEPV